MADGGDDKTNLEMLDALREENANAPTPQTITDYQNNLDALEQATPGSQEYQAAKLATEVHRDNMSRLAGMGQGFLDSQDPPTQTITPPNAQSDINASYTSVTPQDSVNTTVYMPGQDSRNVPLTGAGMHAESDTPSTSYTMPLGDFTELSQRLKNMSPEESQALANQVAGIDTASQNREDLGDVELSTAGGQQQTTERTV